jgi:ethanolamine ammonia-lyase small subunit
MTNGCKSDIIQEEQNVDMEYKLDEVIRQVLAMMQAEAALSEEEKNAAQKKLGEILTKEGIINEEN